MMNIIGFIIIGFVSRMFVDYIGVPADKQFIASVMIIVMFAAAKLDMVIW